jgi:hypothetical protein
VTILAGTAAGTYYLMPRRRDQVGETIEMNTASSAVQVWGRLVVSALPSRDGGAGSPITVMDTTKNQGLGVPGPSITRFVSGRRDAGRRPAVGSWQLAPAAGASSTAATTLTIPSGTAADLAPDRPGRRRRDGERDPRVNNATARSIQIGRLVVTGVSAPGAGAGDGDGDGDYPNQAAGRSRPDDGLHLSANATWTRLTSGSGAGGPGVGCGRQQHRVDRGHDPAGTVPGGWY